MTGDIYQGRCIGGPCNGEWLVVGKDHFDVDEEWSWSDIPNVPAKAGRYHWKQGQWNWSPAQ